MKPIAVIRLAPGEVGFYDELTRIHLTRARPERVIFSDMNTFNIKKGVRSGRLQLVSGSLSKPESKEVSPGRVGERPAMPAIEVKAKRQEAIDKAAFEQGAGEITIEPRLTSEDLKKLGEKIDTGGNDKKSANKKKGKKKS